LDRSTIGPPRTRAQVENGARVVAQRWEDRATFQPQRALKPRALATTRRCEDCVRGCWGYANRTVAIGG